MKRKILIGGAVVGTLLLCYGLFQHFKVGPEQSRARLRTALLSNMVLLDATNFVSTTTPLSAQDHQTLVSKLQTNIKQLQQTPKAQLTKVQRTQIDQLLTSEQSTLKTYSQNVSNLYLVLSYNPIDDIGKVSGTELTSRAHAAASGIDAVLQKDVGQILSIDNNSVSLSSAAHSQLAEAKHCFELLAAQKTSRATCIRTFATARQAVNDDLESMWANKTIETERNHVYKIITALSQS
jgi:hypothetical protein